MTETVVSDTAAFVPCMSRCVRIRPHTGILGIFRIKAAFCHETWSFSPPDQAPNGKCTMLRDYPWRTSYRNRACANRIKKADCGHSAVF